VRGIPVPKVYTTTIATESFFRASLQLRGSSGSSLGRGINSIPFFDLEPDCWSPTSTRWTVPGIAAGADRMMTEWIIGVRPTETRSLVDVPWLFKQIEGNQRGRNQERGGGSRVSLSLKLGGEHHSTTICMPLATMPSHVGTCIYRGVQDTQRSSPTWCQVVGPIGVSLDESGRSPSGLGTPQRLTVSLIFLFGSTCLSGLRQLPGSIKVQSQSTLRVWSVSWIPIAWVPIAWLSESWRVP
jgi:hypothetical protein